ncbi:putative F-box/LRR-repeat protein 23 [Silene latifolia]|uniref:putative F-box/LRR-repeat protein 23 n=1 Tax=Silene latifolia TaxID=37657 RepID=UPI003D784B47
MDCISGDDHIRINNIGQPNRDIKLEKMLFNAIDRSDGRLIDLDIQGFGSDELCSYFASRSCQLKRLRLARCRNISARAVKEAFEKLSCLEELELTDCPFQNHKVITTVKFDKFGLISETHDDVEAFVIAGKLPELRRLHLTKSRLTNVGLMKILDACPHLRSLDLRDCFNLNLSQGNLRKRVYEQIKDIQYLPYKFT